MGLGTNLGDRKRNISEAIERLDRAFGCHYAALSSIRETEPWGFESQDSFLNCAVRYDLSEPTDMSQTDFALGILKICKDIESAMGRSGNPEYDSSGKRIYRSRIIDIDILLFGNAGISLPRLEIPHPRLWERDFALLPLSEIISDPLRSHYSEYFGQ